MTCCSSCVSLGAPAAGLAGSLVAGIGKAGLAALASHPPIWIFAAYGVWYLGLLLTLGVVGRIYTLQRVWRRVAGACVLLNPVATANVMAAGEAASALGEGLADGLDFAGF